MLDSVDRLAGTLLALLVCVGCGGSDPEPGRAGRLSHSDFHRLLNNLGEAWQNQDTETAVALFAPDAVYMQPPDVQLFVGHDELSAYFGAVQPGTTMVWHHLWFDREAQIGAGEFTFGVAGREEATHGVAIIELRNGRISRWHEYLQAGPAERVRFLSPEGKDWQWHIGNYP